MCFILNAKAVSLFKGSVATVLIYQHQPSICSLENRSQQERQFKFKEKKHEQ